MSVVLDAGRSQQSAVLPPAARIEFVKVVQNARRPPLLIVHQLLKQQVQPIIVRGEREPLQSHRVLNARPGVHLRFHR